MGISIELGVASVHQDRTAFLLRRRASAGVIRRIVSRVLRVTAGSLNEASPYVCLPWGSLSFLLSLSGSSTKTAGGSLAGKESIEASSTRRSRRIRCSSDEAGWLIWILRPTIVAIA